MTGENIIGLIIIIFVASIMIAIGIGNIVSLHPCSFYTGEEPLGDDKIIDIKKYNRGHGMGWIIYGIIMILVYFLGFFIEDVYFLLLFFIEVIGGLILLIGNHHRLLKKYKKE